MNHALLLCSLVTCLVPGLVGLTSDSHVTDVKPTVKEVHMSKNNHTLIGQKTYQGGQTLRDKPQHKQNQNQNKMPQGLSVMKNKQKVLQLQAAKLTKREENNIAKALVEQLMRLMENAANFTKIKKTASKKAMIWPNKMIPWLRKMLMKKFLGNEGDLSSNEGLPNIGGFSQTSMASDTYGDAELPSTQSNENSPQEEFPDNYDSFVSKSRTHHKNLKLFPLLNMLKTRLNGGIGLNGEPNLVAKQLLNQLFGGASDRGAVVREMLQEFSLSNGNDRDSSEAREAYNELLGGNPLAPIPQTSLLPGLGPGTTSLAQDKSMNMLQAMSTQQSRLPMAFARGRTANSITDEGLQAPKLLAGLPSPLVQKMMAEGDTFEEIKDPNSLRTEAYMQSPIGLARALQLEKAQAQLGETRARLQESPNRFIDNQPIIQQTTNMQDLLAMRHNFPLKRKQMPMFQKYQTQLRKLYKDNLERAEVNRLMRLGPNFSAWPKGRNADQLPSELGSNMESLAQQRSFNPQFPTAGEHNTLTYLNQQNVLKHMQLDPANPSLAGPQLNQFRPRNPIDSTALGLQGVLGNQAGLRASIVSRFDNQRMNEGLMGVLNRRGDLPTGKISFQKKSNEKAESKKKPK